MNGAAIDPRRFRSVMGTFPTGVALTTLDTRSSFERVNTMPVGSSAGDGFMVRLETVAWLVCTEDLIRVDDAVESPKLAG